MSSFGIGLAVLTSLLSLAKIASLLHGGWYLLTSAATSAAALARAVPVGQDPDWEAIELTVGHRRLFDAQLKSVPHAGLRKAVNVVWSGWVFALSGAAACVVAATAADSGSLAAWFALVAASLVALIVVLLLVHEILKRLVFGSMSEFHWSNKTPRVFAEWGQVKEYLPSVMALVMSATCLYVGFFALFVSVSRVDPSAFIDGTGHMPNQFQLAEAVIAQGDVDAATLPADALTLACLLISIGGLAFLGILIGASKRS